jgi:ATP/maltotriose-dependent transcriptional regulator MalT
MLEAILAAIMAVLQAPWFAPLLTMVLGWLLPQPAFIQKVWTGVMGVRHSLDKVEEIIDTVDAVLKSNGIISKDTPKLSSQEVQAVVNGQRTVEEVGKAQKARMTRRG